MYGFQGQVESYYWYEIVLKVKLCFSQFACPKPVFPRTVFTSKYRSKNRVPSKTLQPWKKIGSRDSIFGLVNSTYFFLNNKP